MTLSLTWIGNLRGTWIGNLFAEVLERDGARHLTVKVGGPNGTMTTSGPLAEVSEGSIIRLATEGNPALVLSLTVTEYTGRQILGKWSASDGNAGVFDLTATDRETPPTNEETATVYVTNKSVPLPRLTLFRDEIKEIIATMEHLLPSGYQVWVKAGIEGKEDVAALDKAFWQKANLPKSATELTLTLSETASPVARVLTVSLGTHNSFYSASGMDEIWVAGALQRLGDVFENKRSWWLSLYEEHGLNFNGVAAIIALIAAPSLQLVPRIIFAVVTLSLMIGFFFLHRATTKMRINLRQDSSPSKLIELPRIITSVIGGLLVAIIAWLASQLTDARLADWLNFLSQLVRQGE